MKYDYSLYLVTDRANICKDAENADGRSSKDTAENIAAKNVTGKSNEEKAVSFRALCTAVEQAILGGCTMVQLREKKISSKDFYNLAKEVKQVTDKHHIPLIINDRMDIALAVKAAGVHIGQRDIPVAAARKVIGKNMLLGVSASSLREAVRALKDGADYLGVGAMYPTQTKGDAEHVTKEELQAVRKAIPIPIVAIGGIDKEKAAKLMKLGIDGVAVVSAILAQPDIRKAAGELRKAVREKSI